MTAIKEAPKVCMGWVVFVVAAVLAVAQSPQPLFPGPAPITLAEKLQAENLQLKKALLQQQTNQMWQELQRQTQSYKDAVMAAHPEMAARYQWNDNTFGWDPQPQATKTPIAPPAGKGDKK